MKAGAGDPESSSTTGHMICMCICPTGELPWSTGRQGKATLTFADENEASRRPQGQSLKQGTAKTERHGERILQQAGENLQALGTN